MVGGFNLSSANVSAANLIMHRFADQLEAAFLLDKSLGEPGAELLNMAGERFVLSPTGPLNRCEDDVRRFFDAALSGVKRALKAGAKKPLLLVIPDERLDQSLLVAIMGDMQGTDPERMAPPKVEEYVRNLFSDKKSNVKMSVVQGNEKLKKEYPCMAAVDRCANQVERHRARAIWLEYSNGTPERTICLVGKGITYDTGGADIKAGGIMAGMHRDKGGASAVAGFMQAIDMMKPKNIRIIAGMAVVRNSVGSEAYLSDEIITARSGKRVRVGNTDAEGRMAMVDLLCHVKERCVNEDLPNPEIYTIATLTGHVCVAYGNYTAIVPNGPYKAAGLHHKLQENGELIGDPFDVSSLRREDYQFHMGKDEQSDILQCNNAPSSRTPRGHQTPAAFMILTSGLKEHGIDSAKPLKYAHLDIAGSEGSFPGLPSGAPISALLQHYFF